MINVGVIGYGYWGPNIVRNFHELKDTLVTHVCDIDPSKLVLAKKRYPYIKTTTNYKEICTDKNVNAIAIITPLVTHFEVALHALRNDKHVFVAKPFTETKAHAIELIKESSCRKLTLMVDHTFIYTGAVKKIKELVISGEIGNVNYFDSIRVNLGLFQHDANVIWDLAVHDISIMDYVLSQTPCAVSATGISHLTNEPENVAYLTLFFDDKLIVHINVNWLAPVKVRTILIGGNSKMIVYDDLEPSEKVKVYDRGIIVNDNLESVYKMLISYRTGDMLAPKLDMTEALKTELEHFVFSITNNTVPETDGMAGLRTVCILEAATKSMKQRGTPVEISYK